MDYDLESQLLVQALKEAEGQRAVRMPKATMQGRYAMLPGAGAALDAGFNRALGNYQKPQIEQGMRGLSEQQQGEQQALMQELMTPGTRSKEQLVQGQGPLMAPPTETVQTPLSPLDESRRRLDVYGRMSNLPMARKMAQAGIASEVDMPERMALRDQATAAAQAQQAERIAAQQQMQSDRLVDQRERDKDRFSQQENMARLAASLRPAPGGGGEKSDKRIITTADADGNPVQQVVDLSKLEPGAQFGKPTTAASAKKDKLAGSGERIDKIISDAKANEAAFGIIPSVASMLPNAIGSRVTSAALSEDQRVARSNVMRNAAQEIHELYGAALSRGEAGRANSFAPNPNDDYDTIMGKLKSAKEYATSLTKGGGKSDAPPADDPAAKEARYQAWKKANGY